MHFALPPRKTDKPPPYAPRQQRSFRWLRWLRQRRIPAPAIYAVGALLTLALVVSLFRSGDGGDREYVPPGTPRIVLVTAFDPAFGDRYERTIVENHNAYARKHDYGFFHASSSDYDMGDPPAPPTWSRVPAMRHAMASFPHSEYFFYVDQHALIMRPDLSIESHILNNLTSLLLVDKPVVPPSSVIRTYQNTKLKDIDAVFTQDHEGVGSSIFLLRRGEWAKYFLDAWFDPLYRSYNFQRAERHALEHLVQWHGTVLMKMALVPQRVLNSYTSVDGEGKYREGDFVANLHGCDAPGAGRMCEKEAEPLVEWLMASNAEKS